MTRQTIYNSRPFIYKLNLKRVKMDMLIQHQHYLRENTCRGLKKYYWG